MLTQQIQQLDQLTQQACDQIAKANDIAALEAVRIHYLGKKGEITEIAKRLGKLNSDDRPILGQHVNQARQTLQAELHAKKTAFEQAAINAQLASQAIDVSLAGRGHGLGHAHPVSLTRQHIEQFFISRGFNVASGPEIEDEFYNFDALNIPTWHPARADHDTFYFGDGRLLRTHTSNVQIRTMQQQSPPLRVIAPGRVYRSDSDLTHSPMFHQIEGLWVDEQVSFADLKGVLHAFLSDFFGQAVKLRLRPSYFPFTEPSAEVDIACVQCKQVGCRVCSGTGWLEVLGCGMVHPNVLNHVGIDSERYQGFAFGLGLDRFAMLRYGIDDLRAFFDNDVQFLQQF